MTVDSAKVAALITPAMLTLGQRGPWHPPKVAAGSTTPKANVSR